MNDVIYLEIDDEITRVIDKIRKSKEDGIILVIPRGGAIAQSIVNLKLLARSSQDLGKSIGLVSADKISKNLAAQVKLAVFDNVKEAEKFKFEGPKIGTPDTLEKFEVKSYKKYDLSKLNPDGQKPAIEEEISSEEEVAGGEEEEVGEEENNEETLDEKNGLTAEEAEEADSDFGEEEENFDDSDGKPQKNTIKVNINENEETEAPMQRRNEKRLRPGGTRKVLAVFAIVFALLLASALGAMYVFLPYADASITLKTEDLNKDLDITVDKNLAVADTAKLQLPGKPVELSKDASKQFDATGQKDQGTPAKGKVTISNMTSSKTQVLAKGARLTTSDGKVFTLDAGVMVPGATPSLNNCQIVNGVFQCDTIPGTATADLTAAANGEASNLPIGSKLTIGTMTATNTAAFAGGVTSIIKFVTDDDLKNAETALRTETFNQAKTEIVAKAAADGVIISADGISDTIVTSSSDKNVNDPAEKFTYSLKISYFVLGFAESELRDLVVANLSAAISTDQMLVNPGESKLTYTISDVDKANGLIKIKANLDGKVGQKLAADMVKNDIKNKQVSSAEAQLNRTNGVATSKITVWPTFLTMTPVMANKIKVHFKYQQ